MNAPTPSPSPWLRRVAAAGALLLVLLALLGTFALYRQPDFLVNMANQLWSCF